MGHRTKPAPGTGISTIAFVVLRKVQLALAIGALVASFRLNRGPVPSTALLVTILALVAFIWLDAIVFYRHRTTRGGGAFSTLRWVADLIVLGLLLITWPVIIKNQKPTVPTILADINIFSLVLLNMVFFFTTTIMLGVEDFRLRRGYIPGYYPKKDEEKTAVVAPEASKAPVISAPYESSLERSPRELVFNIAKKV